MPSPKLDADRVYGDSLREIKTILESNHPSATQGEKVVRIGWVLGNLPVQFREIVLNEIQSRVVAGWATGKRPGDF